MKRKLLGLFLVFCLGGCAVIPTTASEILIWIGLFIVGVIIGKILIRKFK